MARLSRSLVLALPLNSWLGDSLAVQGLGLRASTVGGTGSIPSQELRSPMLHGGAKKKKKSWLPLSKLHGLSEPAFLI